jgi:predicted 3-demethylubiquinone-9 3-methyltransferase (glyoxalase superfamily)
MRKVSPFLWFDDQAEEAVAFYVSLFPNAKINNVTRYGEGAPGPAGSVMTIQFEIDGVDIVALNGGPHFKFNEAVSLSVDCDDQAEVDRYWNALSAGGEEGPCGWLKDRWGLSWQVNPHRLGELISDADPRRAKAAMDAMLKQKKIVIAEIEAAADAVTETRAA